MVRPHSKQLLLIPLSTIVLFVIAIFLIVFFTYYALYDSLSKPVYYAFSIVSNDCNSSGLYVGLVNNAGSTVYVNNLTLLVNGEKQQSQYNRGEIVSGGALNVFSGLNCKYLNYNYSLAVQVSYVYSQRINETVNNPITAVINGRITSSSI